MPAMDKYELIEHTADIGLKACGETLDEAFANAALGMFSIIVETDSVIETTSRRVVVTADDIEGLLFDWLNSLLYYFDVETLLFRRFEITEFEDNRLVAVCYGEPFDTSRHSLKLGVKSATYHQLEVDRGRNCVRVFFDV
jgi:SHS2 domain-containing protein